MTFRKSTNKSPRIFMIENQFLTRTIPPFVVNLVNQHADLLRKELGHIKGITRLINKTFSTYKYKAANPDASKRIGIKVVLFELTPEFISGNDIKKNHGINSNQAHEGHEIAYIKNPYTQENVAIFKVDPKFLDNVHKTHKQKDYFYFKVNSDPVEWEIDHFNKMEYRLHIFICTTRTYIPCMNKAKIHSDGHMWMTTVVLDRNNYGITNIFDVNSTSIYNMQYARQIEILTGIPTVMVGKTQYLYYMSCQNNYYSDADPNVEPCIGLQNREVWGLCQTFILIMYLVILHNPELPFENLDNVIRRPGIDMIMYKLGGLLGFGKKMVDILNLPSPEPMSISPPYPILNLHSPVPMSYSPYSL